MDNRDLSDLAVGMSTARTYCFSNEKVIAFSNLVDDFAPVHVDESFAKQMGLPSRVVHGLFVQSIISGMLGNEIPGPNSVINQFTMKMHHPVPVGATVTYEVAISAITPSVSAVTLAFSGRIDEVVAISGKAICSFPRKS